MNRGGDARFQLQTGVFCSLSQHLAVAQTNETDAARWLANAAVGPTFSAPADRASWELKRRQIRAQGDQDSGSPPEDIRAIDSAVRQVYRLYGKEADFQNTIYPGLGHVYTLKCGRERSLGWMGT